MPPKMKKAQKSIASDASLDKKDEHVPSETKGKLGSSGMNGKDHSKLKTPCSIRTTEECRKRTENLDRKEKHVSPENKGGLGKGKGGGEGDSNVKSLSKGNRKYESGKSKGSLDRKGECVSSKNVGRLGTCSSYGEGDPNLKMPSKIKKAHKSVESNGSLDKKDKHVSAEIKGKLCSSRVNGKGHSKMKMPCLLKKKQVSGGNLDKKDEHVSAQIKGKLCSSRVNGKGHSKMKMPCLLKKKQVSGGNLDKKDEHVSAEIKGKLCSSRVNGKGHSKMKIPCLLKKKQVSGGNLDKKDEHVSSENKGKLGNSRSSGESDCNSKTLTKRNKRCESRKNDLDRKEDEHVSLKNEADHNMKALSKRKKRCRSRKKNQSLDKKDKHGSLENDDRVCDDRSHGEGRPNLEMPSTMNNTHKPIESDGNLNKKMEHVSSEIGGKLGTNRINDGSRSKVKVLCSIKKKHEARKRSENLDKMDGHLSSKNEGRLGKSRTSDEGDFNSKTPSKRKEKCESGKGNGEHHVLSENEGRLGNSVGNDDVWMNLKKSVGAGTPGHRIGKLFVSNTEITKGSNGTIVLEGFYEGRTAAVKRLLLAHQDVALQEIESLIASDGDKNIVRLYGAECDQDFMYLALERCACSLYDLIWAYSKSSEKSVFPQDPASNAMQLNLFEGTMQDVNLWREDGHPAPLLLKLMRQVVSGLVHLHHLGIIHRDLKPQSVLITKELCPKLSDMGISRLLPQSTSSSEYHASDYGRSGSQASEQLLAQQTGSVDVFGLGCVLFFCITGGRHPFGYTPKGDDDIQENTVDLSPLEFIPEAADLLARLLHSDPNLRPKALEVLHHPLFWDSKTRLSFLRDISDLLKSKACGTNSALPENLESIAQCVFEEEWNEKIECIFMKHMRRFKVYKFKRVGDLLRIVRNTFSHYKELPPEIQEIVGSSPEDLDSYFAKRFPRLLIETYRFVSMCYKDKEPSPLPEYFNW